MNKRLLQSCLLAIVLAGLFHAGSFAEPPAQGRRKTDSDALPAARGLLARLLPAHADSFVFETVPPDEGRDVFEIEIIRVEGDHDGLQVVEAAGQAEGLARLARAGTAGNAYQVGSVHNLKIVKNGGPQKPPVVDYLSFTRAFTPS